MWQQHSSFYVSKNQNEMLLRNISFFILELLLGTATYPRSLSISIASKKLTFLHRNINIYLLLFFSTHTSTLKYFFAHFIKMWNADIFVLHIYFLMIFFPLQITSAQFVLWNTSVLSRHIVILQPPILCSRTVPMVQQ